ncbi:non-receptor serine/threonine protein kinase [Lithospermum erythrorhizon]|uniref:Non-receptor serine/threonine protein kinase n=1 Tax=Lithospermum erythrorhizon TaxID=34254 RepID=A0AAV3REJ2_LITER
MGCVASKQSGMVTPAVDHSGMIREDSVVGSGRSRVGSGAFGIGLDLDLKKLKKRSGSESVGVSGGTEVGESGRGSSSVSFRLGNLQKYVEGEQVAAGWPAWLSAVAGEAIQGWVPLRAES